MAATQLPPLDFDETGLRISLLPSLHDEIASTLDEDPFADFFERDESDILGVVNKPEPPQARPLSQSRHDSPTLSVAHTAPRDANQKASRPPPPTPPRPLNLTDQYDAVTSPSSHGAVPQHPIPAFQNAFAESLQEVTEGSCLQKPILHELDAPSRRERLLSQPKNEDPLDVKWRYRPGQTQHEVMKLVAQISFGVYLMFNGMANSNLQVIGILQGHIDEIDEFLEITIEDLNQAADDLTKRIQHLKLPMENLTVFEKLLEDRKFRAEILSGNERIEMILARTNAAMRLWDDDIEAGLRSSTVFSSWLNDQSAGQWRQEQPDLVDVFDAMKGNTEGWLIAFEDMNDRAQEVNALIMTLMTIITEIESKAGEVSRRTWSSVRPFSTPFGNPSHPSKSVHGASPSPPSSSHSHNKSSIPSITQVFAPNSLSITPNESNNGDDDDETSYPLPGGLPLLPPLSGGRTRDSSSVLSKPLSEPASESPIMPLSEVASTTTRGSTTPDDPSLFVLQPRTYTPKLNTPVFSPTIETAPSWKESSSIPKKLPLRDRVSNPPTSIHIPSASRSDLPVLEPSSNNAVRNVNSMTDLRGVQNRHNHPPPRPRAVSPMESPSPDLHSLASPFSDRHALQPVRASPHSPLQQRPHTAGGPRQPSHETTAHRSRPPIATANSASVVNKGSQRNKSRDSDSTQRQQQLKKKKSAFGWFKQAFTMDEEERAAFESRRTAAAQQSQYLDPNSPRFLDGRRIR